MRLPKATKLKSGSWRIQLQIDGHRYSCTGATKKEAQDKAKQIFAGAEMEKRVPMTVGRAMDQEYDPYLDNQLSYFLHGAFDTKEKAESFAKEIADDDAKEYDTTPTIEYRDGDIGYELLGSYYFVKEMDVK